MKGVIGSWILIVGLAMGCQPTEKAKEEVVELPPAKPVINFSGDTLQAKTYPDSIYQVLLGKMLDAKALAEQYPDSAELAIWHGRRVAYMGRYHEAIDVFSEAIERFSNDYRLLRHRGHRYLTTRQMDLAIADYEKANKLSKGAPNAIEPDGIPNKLNLPLGNDKFNIYYHQALAYYLNGEFEKAVPVYKQCMAVSDNDDLKVATAYWLYMTLHRIGMEVEANALLADISPDMTIVENDAYLDLALLFKGERTLEETLAKAQSADGIGNPTMMYGIGNWYLQQGNVDKAKEIWTRVLTSKSWDSFGYIAAEAEKNSQTPRDVSRYTIEPLSVNGEFIMAEENHFNNCEFVLNCDCCFGNLSISGSEFEYIDLCEGSTTLSNGTVNYKGDTLILHSNDKRHITEYNWEYDYDSTQPEYFEYDTIMKPFILKFEAFICDESRYYKLIQERNPLIVSSRRNFDN